MAQLHLVTDENDETAKLLAPYIQSGNLNFLIGSGASMPAISVAGDIETRLNGLIEMDEEVLANSVMAGFIEAITSTYQTLKQGPIVDGPVKATLENYKSFVSIIDQILFARKNEILPRQASIFSTNYDMFIEFAVKECGNVIMNDGFDRASGQPDDFLFAPEQYFDRTYRTSSLYARRVEIPTLNLIKLHGSLNWVRKASNLVYRAAVVQPLPEADKADPAQITQYLSKHFLIMPNFKKFHETLMERVYYDLLRIFSKAMEQENAVLLAFGFSFGDEHILDITRRALRNPTSQLIIFAYSHDSIAVFETKFAKHRNVSVIGPAAGNNLNFQRLNKILAAVLPEMKND
jgi:hypothetical protein